LTNPSRIVVAVSAGSYGASACTVSTIADTAGNTYALDKASSNWYSDGATAETPDTEIWAAPNTHTTASNKITVTTNVDGYVTFTACEVTGLAASPIDASNSDFLYNQGAAGPPDCGAITTAQANEIIIACFFCGGVGAALTVPTGFTRVFDSHTGGTRTDGDMVYRIVSATQTNLNVTWNTNLGQFASWGGAVASYKMAAAGGRGLFLQTPTTGLGVGGSFFSNPIGKWQREPNLDTARRKRRRNFVDLGA
jgi:hypothetical protein